MNLAVPVIPKHRPNKSAGSKDNLQMSVMVQDVNDMSISRGKLNNPCSFVTPESQWQIWWAKKERNNEKLFFAIHKGDIETVLDLLNEAKHHDLAANPNSTSQADFTPLHAACQEGYNDIVKLLLSKNVEVNARTEAMRTPLHIACSYGFLSTVSVLCENPQIDFNAQDMERYTPLHYAALGNHNNVVDYLLSIPSI